MPLDDINTGSPLPRPASVIELGGLVFWGIDGDTAEAGDFSYNSTADQVTVLTPKHLVAQNKNMGSSCATSILIPAGTDARIVLNGVSISTSSSAISVEPGASLHLVLADGTLNSLFASRNGAAGLRCTTRGKLVIDDTVPNSGIVPENGEVSVDATLDDGKTQVKRGDPLSVLASDNPGTLDVSSTMSSNLDGACIGGGHSEAGGAPSPSRAAAFSQRSPLPMSAARPVSAAARLAMAPASTSGSPSTAAISRPKAATTQPASAAAYATGALARAAATSASTEAT